MRDILLRATSSSSSLLLGRPRDIIGTKEDTTIYSTWLVRYLTQSTSQKPFNVREL